MKKQNQKQKAEHSENRTRQKSSTRKNKTKTLIQIILVLILINLMIITALIFGGALNSQQKSETLSLEYGEPFIPAEKIEGWDDSLYSLELPETDEKGFIPEGDYSLRILNQSDSSEKGTVNIHVEDTKGPAFTVSNKTVSLGPGMDDLDLNQYFTAEDPSGCTVVFETDDVNFDKEGEYQAKAVAKDPKGHETVLGFKIRITSDPEQLVENNEGTESPYTVPDEDHRTPEVNGTIVKGILICNKKNPLPADFAPGDDPVATEQVYKLIADMQAQGMDVTNSFSGFRTYEYQEQLYNNYAAADGVEAADTYSARPGYSEHQTGLTFDLIGSQGLITSEREAQWIKDNCASYGFIVRYPEGKESVTGYMPEPWHLRYVGPETAAQIMSQGLTLEEYLGVEGGDYIQ